MLVDDEIIAVEMISVKMEEEASPYEAALQAYIVTALPMLLETIITCSGFIPIGFAKGEISEFTSAMFPVLAAALLISWIVFLYGGPFPRLKAYKGRKAREWGRQILRNIQKFS